MILLGLTGGVGMGKSTSAGILQEMGFPVADTDLIAREVVAPGEPALEELRGLFGKDIVLPTGELDRSRVAELVFVDPQARRQLEEVLHPLIRREWRRRVETWKTQGRTLGVVVIPLLYETAAETCFDSVMCVACSSPSQGTRLRERGWTDEQIRARVGAQLPTETKMKRADFVVWTEPPLSVHAAQIQAILVHLVPEGFSGGCGAQG